MGERRMFSLKIMNSAKFLKMPIDAQNLYFHLGLRADDDGIVEAFSVMRLIGSNEDNLKLLHLKEFVHILNEDLVTYITDWREHNTIRADRKIDSIYKDLLVKILPQTQLLESKERADRKKEVWDDIGTSQGRPKDGISKVKLSKDKISKNNIDKDNINNDLLQCNVTVTNCNDNVTNKKESKKENKTFNDMIFEYTDNEELRNLLICYVQMRTKKKATPTNKALELVFKDLDEYSSNKDTLKIKIIENSIKNNWTGVFQLKQNEIPVEETVPKNETPINNDLIKRFYKGLSS